MENIRNTSLKKVTKKAKTKISIEAGNTKVEKEVDIELLKEAYDTLDKIGWRRFCSSSYQKTIIAMRFGYKNIMVLDYLTDRMNKSNEIKTTQEEAAAELKLNIKTVKSTFQALIKFGILVKYRGLYVMNPYFIATLTSKERMADIIYLHDFPQLATPKSEKRIKHKEEKQRELIYKAKEMKRKAEEIEKAAEIELKKLNKARKEEMNIKERTKEELEKRKEKTEDREWEFKQWEADGTTRAEELKLKEERIRKAAEQKEQEEKEYDIVNTDEFGLIKMEKEDEKVNWKVKENERDFEREEKERREKVLREEEKLNRILRQLEMNNAADF